MSPPRKKSAAAAPEPTALPPRSTSLLARVPNPLKTLEPILKRDEADILFIAGNVALVALEVIEWPIAAMTLVLHAMARSRFEALRVVAEVAEEAE
jgi:hypothetical protein